LTAGEGGADRAGAAPGCGAVARAAARAAAAGARAQLRRHAAHGHRAARAHHAPWPAHPLTLSEGPCQGSARCHRCRCCPRPVLGAPLRADAEPFARVVQHRLPSFLSGIRLAVTSCSRVACEQRNFTLQHGSELHFCLQCLPRARVLACSLVSKTAYVVAGLAAGMHVIAARVVCGCTLGGLFEGGGGRGRPAAALHGMETTSQTCSGDADGRLACKPANHSAHIHEDMVRLPRVCSAGVFYLNDGLGVTSCCPVCCVASLRKGFLEARPSGLALTLHQCPVLPAWGQHQCSEPRIVFYVTDPAAVNACCPSPHWCLHRRSGHATYARHGPPTAHVCTLYQSQARIQLVQLCPSRRGPRATCVSGGSSGGGYPRGSLLGARHG